MISVIICSVDREKFTKVSEMYQRVLADEAHEVLGVHGAPSMSAGYNAGMRQAKGDVLLFSHDDVELLAPTLGMRLRRHLRTADIVGIAGTDRMVHPMWSAAGPGHLFGQVAHLESDGTLEVEIFAIPARLNVGMQMMDGVFLAARSNVARAIGWDAETFRGWHAYDADFTYRAHRAGHKLAVAADIPLVHHSRGVLDESWQRAARAFLQKFAGTMPPLEEHEPELRRVRVPDRAAALKVMSGG